MEIKDGVQQEIIISSGILDSIFEHGELANSKKAID